MEVVALRTGEIFIILNKAELVADIETFGVENVDGLREQVYIQKASKAKQMHNTG